MKLSIIIPVFNEEKSVTQVVKKMDQVDIPNITKEIIVVNDGSTDSTGLELKSIERKIKNITIITHKVNQGKGGAVITGIKKSTGDYIIIQDADSEYNP